MFQNETLLQIAGTDCSRTKPSCKLQGQIVSEQNPPANCRGRLFPNTAFLQSAWANCFGTKQANKLQSYFGKPRSLLAKCRATSVSPEVFLQNAGPLRETPKPPRKMRGHFGKPRNFLTKCGNRLFRNSATKTACLPTNIANNRTPQNVAPVARNNLQCCIVSHVDIFGTVLRFQYFLCEIIRIILYFPLNWHAKKCL